LLSPDTTTIPEGAMKKLRLETLKVERFDTTAAAESLRGTVAAHEGADTFRNCPYSYGGTCIISLCQACPTDYPCN
jgi:hypothetical protein